MEREMCQYLEWELNVDLAMLKEFEMGQCVGALAPLSLVLLGSGGFFLLNAGVWVHLHPSRLSCWVLGDWFS